MSRPRVRPPRADGQEIVRHCHNIDPEPAADVLHRCGQPFRVGPRNALESHPPHAQWQQPQRGQFTAAGMDRDQIQQPQVEGRGLEACWLGLELGLDGTVFVVKCVQSLSLLEPDQRVIACTHPGGYVVGELL